MKLKQKEVNWKEVEQEEVCSLQLCDAEFVSVLPRKFRSCDHVVRVHDRVTQLHYSSQPCNFVVATLKDKLRGT